MYRKDTMGRKTSICFSLMTTKFRSLLGFTTLRRPRLVHEQKIMICEKFRHSLQVRGGMTRVMVTSHKSCPTLYPPHYHYPLILPENTPIIGYTHRCRTAKQFLREAQRPPVWQNDHKASQNKKLCVPKSNM